MFFLVNDRNKRYYEPFAKLSLLLANLQYHPGSTSRLIYLVPNWGKKYKTRRVSSMSNSDLYYKAESRRMPREERRV